MKAFVKPATIPQVLEYAADQWGDNAAVIDNIQLNYVELLQKARQVAKAFIANEIQPNERFSIWAPNIHEWIWIAIGGQMAGCILVPMNTRYKGIEASEILTLSQSRLLFTLCDFLDTHYPKLIEPFEHPKLQQTILIRGADTAYQTLDNFLQSGNVISDTELNKRSTAVKATMLCDIMYTSGTTGKPKGVMSNHQQVVDTFIKWSDAVNLSTDDNYLIVNPFFHTFGYKAGWLSCLLTGATIYPESVFDAPKILQRIGQERISMLPGAPTLFQSLLADTSRAQYDVSSLRCAVTGAATVPVQLVRDMQSVLGIDEVYTGYGLTECGVVSICRKGDAIETIANTAGKALEGLDVKIVDSNDQTVPPNNLGTIKVKGMAVMQGYFEDPKATQKAIDSEGWMDTGDIGWMDEKGYIKVTDRKKDMYICGGFNCYPAEIENLLLTHPDILDVAVTGVQHQHMGEVGHAFIVSKTALNSETLTTWCRETMANYKVPAKFSFVASLPRNASGKVQKFLLYQSESFAQ